MTERVLIECPICKRRMRLNAPKEPMPTYPLDEYPEVECGGSGTVRPVDRTLARPGSVSEPAGLD